MKKTAVLAAALLTLSLSGCKKTEKSDNTPPEPTSAVQEETQPETDAPTEDKTEPATEKTDSLYPDYPITYPEIIPHDTGDLYEAEDAKLSSGLKTAGEPAQDGEDGEVFSGEGYVTGFPDSGGSVTFDIKAPSTQHYDLAFSISADTETECKVLVNGREFSSFTTMDDGEFTLITLYGAFLTKGQSAIVIDVTEPSGDIKLDYLRLANNTTLSRLSYDTEDSPVNENAGESAKKLLSFMTESYGRYILSGQYVSDSTQSPGDEIELIHETTGKYPVIRFCALTGDVETKTLNACAEWYKNGGIPGLMWYWNAPGEKPSVYAEETDFRLADAYTELDIAGKTQEEIRGLYSSGQITKECYGLILGMDDMAGQLTILRNKGVPVLWRPLHEAAGDWFWWGADGADAYIWLWELMYKRYTEFFGLDNLIWVWSGQSDTVLVDKDTFDIAALDIYLDSSRDFGSRFEQFAALQGIVGGDKLVALSECSSIPDIDASFRDNAVWSFFGLWYGKYLENDGKLSEEYMKKDYLIHCYNSDGVLTLDEYEILRNGGKLEPEYEQ